MTESRQKLAGHAKKENINLNQEKYQTETDLKMVHLQTKTLKRAITDLTNLLINIKANMNKMKKWTIQKRPKRKNLK